MQSQSRLLDDLTRVASSAVGVAGSVRGQVEARVREAMERAVARMDLVTREQYEAVEAMARQAREDQEALAARVAELERRVAALDGHGESGGGES